MINDKDRNDKEAALPQEPLVAARHEAAGDNAYVEVPRLIVDVQVTDNKLVDIQIIDKKCKH
jgi:hypothetical protein